jgi:translation initiation factor 5
MKDNADASAGEVAEVVVNQQMASALKSHDKINIFLRAVITSSEDFKNKAIEKNAEIIEKITQKNPIMERHLVGAVEDICSGSILEPKYFPVMLKQLFDEEILAEMVILEWAFDGRSEYTFDSVDEDMRSSLRAKAEPVIVWLQEEDSDSDDSDSDSDSD